MKNKIIILLPLFFVFVFTSCSSMYVRPTIEPVLYRQEVPGSAELIFKAALRILPMMGYEIEGSNASAGTITTGSMNTTIDPSECDCGSAMGMGPVVKRGGIKAKVYFVLSVSRGELVIRAVIEPQIEDMMATIIGAGAAVTCVSKGGLEKMFARKFMEKMGTNAIRMLFN